MVLNRFVLAAAVAIGIPSLAAAVPATYDFRTGVSICFDCSEPHAPSLAFSPGIGAPTLTVTSTGDGTGVNQFDTGLSVGGAGSSGGTAIGDAEELLLDFNGQTVTLIDFTITTFRSPGQQGEVSFNGMSETFSYGADDGTQVATTTPNTTLSGDVFTFTNLSSDPSGYILSAVTIDFEPDETPVIPVPPALPLLGGAVALLVWRAQRAKKSA